ncbi:LOW QUALITY PROTEIN: transcription elongation regulator 1-like [Ctenocephalides felis]|uniref:LOW QUALITY PROTEIN: transcription elongation regulator 1-like n=1 Tax=Ctenocephalides felis TaxID=7515 RepID=UPI000E6E4438|nr:LOW QUALITY PROTEIN: transcription elongation regulator 1-like [Ctenocephalides felis]
MKLVKNIINLMKQKMLLIHMFWSRPHAITLLLATLGYSVASAWHAFVPPNIDPRCDRLFSWALEAGLPEANPHVHHIRTTPPCNIKKDFLMMLREHKDIDRHSRWADVKKKVENDPRYKNADSSATREGKGEKESKERKERKDSSSKHENKKESGKKDEKNVSADSASVLSSGEQLSEGEGSHKERTLSNNSMTEEEDEKQKEREKKARAEQSIREREKEVQRTLATHMRDRDKEREHHKRDEAVQHFTALLSDLVRTGEPTWREAKRLLRKDHRWDLADLLDREEKERLFDTHMEQLNKKKRDKFREMLDDLQQVTLTSSWKEVKKIIKEDPRYTKFSSSEKCEREFRDYMKDKLGLAKVALKELLQETKLITHKSLATVKENPQHLTEIENLLTMDKRYLVLEHLGTERTNIVMNYLEELDKRGPPPPPTASEPTRRLK